MDPVKGEKGLEKGRTPERFLDLIEPIKEGLLRYSRALTIDRDQAKDLASEAILIAYQAFGKLRSEEALTSYLYTTLKRLARNNWQRDRRITEIDDAYYVADTGTSPEILTDIRLLQEALLQLPEIQREAIILHELSGLQLEEIREIQGGSLSAVKMRLLRGKEKLAELLGESKPRSQSNTQEQLNKLSTLSI